VHLIQLQSCLISSGNPNQRTCDNTNSPCFNILNFWQVLLEESKRGPVILHIKDAERSIMGNLDKYLTLRKKLENLQGPIVAIASYTMPDVGKEKVGASSSCSFIWADSWHDLRRTWKDLIVGGPSARTISCRGTATGL
jgi:hypothetical protein